MALKCNFFDAHDSRRLTCRNKMFFLILFNFIIHYNKRGISKSDTFHRRFPISVIICKHLGFLSRNRKHCGKRSSTLKVTLPPAMFMPSDNWKLLKQGIMNLCKCRWQEQGDEAVSTKYINGFITFVKLIQARLSLCCVALIVCVPVIACIAKWPKGN